MSAPKMTAAQRNAVKPECFTEKDWALMRKAPFNSRTHTYCWDCRPEFKARHLAAGTCQWPCVEFITDEHGTNGHRMSLIGKAAK